jgi:hypothetical protein
MSGKRTGRGTIATLRCPFNRCREAQGPSDYHLVDHAHYCANHET